MAAVSKVAVYPMETKVFLMAVGDSASIDSGRLWHGVVFKGLENFLYNGSLWFLKELVRPPSPDPKSPERRPPASFLRAFAASCAAVLLAHPFANVVVGMQASLRNPAQRPLSALSAARAILKADGLGGFFRGWKLSILLRLGSAMTLVVYEFVRLHLAGVVGRDLSNFVAGLSGRLSEVYSVQPLKTLRSRQQLGQAMLPSASLSGVIKLWDGVGTMAVADALKIGVRFLLVERMRTLLQWALIASRRRQRSPSCQKAEVAAKGAEVVKRKEMAMVGSLAAKDTEVVKCQEMAMGG